MPKPIVMITGASRGLGAAIAQVVASMGAIVVLNGRTKSDLKIQLKKIKDAGGEASFVVGNVGKNKDRQKLIETAYNQYGRIDALINNAGIIEPIAPISKASTKEWDHNLNINLLAPVALSQIAIPYLRETQGRIINISSGASLIVVQGWSAYSVAKAGLNQFTKYLAQEEPSITAIALRPGLLNTDMQAVIREKGKTGMPESALANFVNQYESGKLLPPEFPAKATAFLALHAPHELSGEFLQWDDERVQKIVQNN